MEEFACDVDFKFGVPLIILDMIYALTGHEVIGDIRKCVIPPSNIERLNPDCPDLGLHKADIDEEYHELIFGIFNQWGELNLQKLQEEQNARIQESTRDNESLMGSQQNILI